MEFLRVHSLYFVILSFNCSPLKFSNCSTPWLFVRVVVEELLRVEYTALGRINAFYTVILIFLSTAKARSRSILQSDLPRNTTAEIGGNAVMKCIVLVSVTLPDFRWLKWVKSVKSLPKQFDNLENGSYKLIDLHYQRIFQIGENYGDFLIMASSHNLSLPGAFGSGSSPVRIYYCRPLAAECPAAAMFVLFVPSTRIFRAKVVYMVLGSSHLSARKILASGPSTTFWM